MSIIVQAVYKQGTFKLLEPVTLPEDEPVDLLVTRRLAQPGVVPGRKVVSLRGIWKNLPLPDEEEVETAIRQLRARSQRRVERLAQELAESLQERP